jgi:general secretion pathway protein M
MMDKLLAFWNDRAPREKTALGALGMLLLLAITYLVLLEPAILGIQRQQKNLPQTRAQVAQLGALLTEAKTLKSQPQVATVSPVEARSALDKSLAASGLKAARVVPLSDGDLQITFSNVPFAAWSLWLAQIERELGARAISVNANSNGTPGQVDVELALRLARR